MKNVLSLTLIHSNKVCAFACVCVLASVIEGCGAAQRCGSLFCKG